MNGKTPLLANGSLVCSDCGLELPTEPKWYAHTRNCTPPILDGQYVCRKNGCGFQTRHPKSLKEHVAYIHVKSTVYHCRLCSYNTARGSDLTKHYKHTHKGDGLDEWLAARSAQSPHVRPSKPQGLSGEASPISSRHVMNGVTLPNGQCSSAFTSPRPSTPLRPDAESQRNYDTGVCHICFGAPNLPSSVELMAYPNDPFSGVCLHQLNAFTR